MGCADISEGLKIQAAGSSETLVIIYRHHNLEDGNF
jgi:hypothetical protein